MQLASANETEPVHGAAEEGSLSDVMVNEVWHVWCYINPNLFSAAFARTLDPYGIITRLIHELPLPASR